MLRRGVSRLVREHQASASGTLNPQAPPLDTAFLLLGCKRDLRRDEQVLPDSSQYQRVKARAPVGASEAQTGASEAQTLARWKSLKENRWKSLKENKRKQFKTLLL